MFSLYQQNISGTLETHIGKGGATEDALQKSLDKMAPLFQKIADAGYPFFTQTSKTDDLADLAQAVNQLKSGTDDIFILGTGGSSLGGKTLYSLADKARKPRLHFMDNIDPVYFDEIFSKLDPTRTGLIAISKSGETAETLAQFMVCKKWFGRFPKNKTLVITEPTSSSLRQLAAELDLQSLNHDPNIGGRYTVFSNVGMLPALLAGIDAHAVRKGADMMYQHFLTQKEKSFPAQGAALSYTLLEEKNISSTVLMPYCDGLKNFGLWFRQLWAESLGKDGKGLTPINAIGTVDQHSQLQLWLDGPADKFFTLIFLDRAGTGEEIESSSLPEALAYLRGKTMGDLMAAEQQATADSLIEQGRPTRILSMPQLDAHTLGALMMQFMLETVLTAGLLEIDPFDQPAVERGKILMKEYLVKK
ncbi:MAG: glucose-6-phosphate isomerase [Alphaproteobacteria bacterium]